MSRRSVIADSHLQHQHSDNPWIFRSGPLKPHPDTIATCYGDSCPKSRELVRESPSFVLPYTPWLSDSFVLLSVIRNTLELLGPDYAAQVCDLLPEGDIVAVTDLVWTRGSLAFLIEYEKFPIQLDSKFRECSSQPGELIIVQYSYLRDSLEQGKLSKYRLSEPLQDVLHFLPGQL